MVLISRVETIERFQNIFAYLPMQGKYPQHFLQLFGSDSFTTWWQTQSGAWGVRASSGTTDAKSGDFLEGEPDSGDLASGGASEFGDV
jgi:hypothetical protein